MNVKNAIGVALCLLVFAVGFATTDGALRLFNLVGLLVVLSGTIGGALLSYPFESLVTASRVAWHAYVSRPPATREVVDLLLRISVQSRFDGIHSLERFEKTTSASFLKHALEMMVDGYRPEELSEVLTTEMAYFRRRRQRHERVFRQMARLAPAFGVAGSVIGLMGMLYGIGDTGVILRTIPLALTSTLYGVVLSNFLLTPVAERIHSKTVYELLVKRLVLDGVLAIMAEQNPHKLEKKLQSFVTPASRGGGPPLEEIRRRYAELREKRAAVS